MHYVLGRTWRRILFWARRRRLSEELAEELELHVHLKESGNRQRRVAEAQQVSNREMGNLTLAQEESRDMWGFVFLDNLLHDIRYALRVFRRNPAFATSSSRHNESADSALVRRRNSSGDKRPAGSLNISESFRSGVQ